jgi:F-type H+-transporting ATPase subunit epsilon
MAKLFNVNIVTPLKVLYSGKAFSMVVPASTGYLGILADHAPMVAVMASGKISLKEDSGNDRSIDYQGGGFLEVLNNQVTLLLDPPQLT